LSDIFRVLRCHSVVAFQFAVIRFGLVEGDVNNIRLFVLVNPVGRQGRQRAFLQLWLPEDGSLKRAMPCNDSLSALAVSDDGKFVAVGTMFGGSVSVYTAFNLQVQFLVCYIFCECIQGN
jgi:prolactin regulatory element-binding protein